ncbi:unnamed protein product, partial [Polarella glacialis]
DPESVFYVHAGNGWGSYPEAAAATGAQQEERPSGRPAPRLRVVSFDSKEQDGRSFSRRDHGAWVRVEVVRELVSGDPVAGGHFEQCWGALIRISERPPPRAPRFGSPWPCDEEVSPRQWLERAGFAVFLRAIGAVERGIGLPGTPEELRRRCGVVAVEDDGFCGFWCLAYLLRLDLASALQR